MCGLAITVFSPLRVPLSVPSCSTLKALTGIADASVHRGAVLAALPDLETLAGRDGWVPRRATRLLVCLSLYCFTAF